MTSSDAQSKEKRRDPGGDPSATSAPTSLLRPAEVLQRAEITHQVLYRYVTLGLIEPAATTPTGQRLFHPDVIELIGAIKVLTRKGYSLRDMKETYFREARVRRALTVEPTTREGSDAENEDDSVRG